MNETFAQRLKKIIEDKGLSQAEVARLCNISQQSINYIINKNLRSSKLAPKIAHCLEINPEWLIYGEGKQKETQVYEIPIIHSVYMFKKFLRNKLNFASLEYTIIDVNLGPTAFAYLIEPSKMAVCFDHKEISSTIKENLNKEEYLCLNNNQVSVITEANSADNFLVFEWRLRNAEFE